MSQHRPSKALRHEVATYAFTGGVAMLIDTPYTKPMTTYRWFQITMKGPSTTMLSMNFLMNQTKNLRYVFIDELSFLSYHHLKDIVDQLIVELGLRAQKGKPFGGMNFVFFKDYKQLSKSANFPMYKGIATEATKDLKDMKIWFQTKMENRMKKTLHDPYPTFIRRKLWTSIDMIYMLTIKKRQIDTEAGQKLNARCQSLHNGELMDDFFDNL